MIGLPDGPHTLDFNVKQAFIVVEVLFNLSAVETIIPYQINLLIRKIEVNKKNLNRTEHLQICLHPGAKATAATW